MTVRPADGQVSHGFRLLPDPQYSSSGQQAYFAYELAAGRAIEDVVVVRNESKKALNLRLFSADAVTASRGGAAITGTSIHRPNRVGARLQLSKRELILDVGEIQRVPFTLRLPGDLAPGEYAASIVAQPAEEVRADRFEPTGVRFIPRFAVMVLVTIRGSGSVELQPRLEIKNLRVGHGLRQQSVVAELSNTGNDGLGKAEGNLTIRRTDGDLLQIIPVRLGYFLTRLRLRPTSGAPDPGLKCGARSRLRDAIIAVP